MKYYMTKKYDEVACKNVEESEEREEITGTMHFDFNCIGIKNIHNKKKEYR